MKDKTLRIIPLGGLGEVGRNMMLYEYHNDIIVVDTGMMFPDATMYGVDYIIPDLTYLVENKHKVKGIIITHGHEDHTGAIRHVLNEVNVPVYATPLTLGMVEAKLARAGNTKAQLNAVKPGDKIRLGYFEVEFYHVCHSVPDGTGIGITTPAGLVVHQSDYKFDHTPVDNQPPDYAKLAEFSQRGVLALLADSTNAERPGWTPSERVIDGALDDVFREAPGRIIIASFASLISRMQQVGVAANRYGRKLAFVGTSMQDNVKIARKLGYIDFPEGLVVPIDQALKLPDSQVAIMVTGSQGEPTSIMGRLSKGTNRLFDIKPGDTVILSSHPIPGNEENVYGTINRLIQRGADVIHEAIAPVHVSGHASQEEMKLLIHLTRPKFVIPMHGELRHLHQHARIAKQVGIPAENILIVENGQVIELTANSIKLGEKVPAGMVFVEGSSVGEVDEDTLQERESLARDGIVMVNVTVDRYTGSLRRDPVITSRGFQLSRDGDEIIPAARQRIHNLLSVSGNPNLVKEIEREISALIFDETRRRPIVYVTVARE
ncbi:MAG TPA: ribonuclease J [Bellilinea sp.]|nr:ribonuclease J [Bellilinea sp.]